MILAVYKPSGPTSHDVIREIKKIVGIKKVGHAGTLDPLASGVLVVGIGRDSTKKLASEVQKEKEYTARIKLGMSSTTDDEEGEKTEIKVKGVPSLEKIRLTVQKFVGEIKQTPPLFSAVKISGQEAYKLARQGKKATLKSRLVNIKSIQILGYKWPYLTLRVVTGPGVYIRSLARDLGKELKTGGYLTALERTRVGDFTKDQAIPLSRLCSCNLE